MNEASETSGVGERVRVAVVQAALGGSRAENVARVTDLVREAAARGANVVLVPELFEGPYFCKTESEAHFALAHAMDAHPGVEALAELAREHGIVIPASVFERDGPHYYNSIAMIDADGRVLGVYRKSHIPDGPGYEEKFYFRPGDTGFRAWRTRHGTIGVGICWDQWFPEAARAMVLAGADLLLYPTAIGSEPHDPGLDTRDPWRRVMIGHAVANATPVAAANRIGTEDGQRFYGSSFISDVRGDLLADLGRDEEGIGVADIDLAAVRRYRASFGLFRDRRPDLYAMFSKRD
jgi:N-carbamoylputrescine amidase